MKIKKSSFNRFSSPHNNDHGSEISLEDGREGSTRRENKMNNIRQERKEIRMESNDRERKRMHKLIMLFRLTIFTF